MSDDDIPLIRRSVPPGGSPKVKGVALRSVLHGFSGVCGEEALNKAVALCPPEVRDAVTYRRLVATGWYPIEWYKALLGAFCQVGQGRSVLREVGRKSSESDINGVYRALLKLLAPATILSLYARLFSNYFTHGNLVLEEKRAGYVRVRLTECLGFDRNVYAEMLAGAERLLELSGARHVRAHFVKGGGDGDTSATIEAHWS